MNRDIFIAGENGEVYHITEDQLKATHKVAPKDLPAAQQLFKDLPDNAQGATTLLRHRATGGGYSQSKSESSQLLKLGATHDAED